mgnify:CR=1 FL=1
MFFKNKKNNRQENKILMEIYKDLSNPALQEFDKLLNSQLSKIQIEEGKIIEGKINKITDKFVFLFVEGLKSEPVLDINELKSMGLSEKIKIGETIPVLLEKIEDKIGDVLVSASKDQKIKGILFDLGYSFTQIKDPKKGLSFNSVGDLNMQMGLNNFSASDAINNLDVHELEKIFKFFGEELESKIIAFNIFK